MLTIGVDPHKRTHSAVAVDEVGAEVSGVTESAVPDGFGALLRWSRLLPDPEHLPGGLLSLGIQGSVPRYRHRP